MDVLLGVGSPWRGLVVVVRAATGAAYLWRGMRGTSGGEGGLARRRSSFVGRLKGFQFVVSGLMLAGFAAALALGAPWLVYLALGIGELALVLVLLGVLVHHPEQELHSPERQHSAPKGSL